jgi:hypothetical protein
MAKKKAVKKKAVKKKVTKKKGVKKKATKKTPARTLAKPASSKKSGKKKSGRPAPLGVRQIKYRCMSGVCTATPKFPHLTPGDTVSLDAIGTDVTITFLVSSPFVSGTNPIYIANGNTDPEIVGTTHGTFEYTVQCSACHRTSVANPEMIVP